MDVVTAFLYGDLEEDILWMSQMASRIRTAPVWSANCKNRFTASSKLLANGTAKIHNVVVEELEVTSISSDPCLYGRHKSCSILIIALYVGDLLIAGSSKSRNRLDQGVVSQTV